MQHAGLSLMLLVMLCLTFIFAICFVQAASNPNMFAGIPVRELFMSLLFMSATGGLHWQGLADGLYHDGLHYYFFMLLHVGLFLFVIENALTSMFVKKILDIVQHDVTFVV